MDRFAELKVKGWKNLEKGERLEWKALEDSEKVAQDRLEKVKTGVEDSKGSSEGVVEIGKRDLEGLLARLDRLEQMKQGVERNAGLQTRGDWQNVKETTKLKTATIRKYREKTDESYKYVIWREFLMSRWNVEKRTDEQIYKIHLYDPADKETMTNPLVITKPLLEFAKTFEKEQVTILEMKKEKQEKVVGQTQKVVVNYSDFKSFSGGNVPMTVSREETTCLIKLENGDEFWVKSGILNE